MWWSGTGAAAPSSSGSGATASDADEDTREGGCFLEHHERTPEKEKTERHEAGRKKKTDGRKGASGRAHL